MKIYFTRHGQTEWNKIQKNQGWLNSELTPEGIQMGEKLREELKEIKFDKIFTSDIKRAYHTAELIKPDQELVKTPLLREIDLGDWSGKYFKDLPETDPQRFDNYFNHPEKYFPEQGESFIDLMDRIEKFFKEYVENKNYKTILIVSHGVTMTAIMNYMEKNTIENFWTNKVRKNGEINIAEYQNRKYTMIKKAGEYNQYTAG